MAAKAKKCLCPGDLRHRLTVEHNATETNADGQKVGDWTAVFKIWARVTTRGAMERRVFEQMRAECDYLVQSFWNSRTVSIKPADYRFIFDGRTLNIGGAYDPTGERQEMQFHCTEVVV